MSTKIKIKDLEQAEKDQIIRVVLKDLNVTVKFYFKPETVLTAGIVIKLLERTINRLDYGVNDNDLKNLKENNETY